MTTIIVLSMRISMMPLRWYINIEDCDDDTAQSNTNIDDTDCDGILSSEDYDDNDNSVQYEYQRC